jgi:hypothetical protein
MKTSMILGTSLAILIATATPRKAVGAQEVPE